MMTMSFDGELKTALFAGGGCTYGVTSYVVCCTLRQARRGTT